MIGGGGRGGGGTDVVDFRRGMKRKQLQALCKKHGIPANLSNSRMALLLSSTLKATEKPVSIVHEEGVEKETEDAPNKFKKVRFSPEIETREYEPSVYKKKGGRKRRSLVSDKSPQITGNINEGGEKSSTNLVEDPPRTRRSRERKQVERDDEFDGKASAIGNKIGIEVKIDSEVSVGKASETGQGVRRSRRILEKHPGVENCQQVVGMVARSGARVAANESEVENEVGDFEVVRQYQGAARNEKALTRIAGRASRRKSVVPGKDKVENDEQEAKKATRKRASRNSPLEIGFEQEPSKQSTAVEVEKASLHVGNLRRSKRNTVMSSSSLAAKELRVSETVGKIRQLSEQASGNEVNDTIKGPRRSTRNASRCASTASISNKINENNDTAGKNERRKRKSEPGSKKETSVVACKTSARKLTRRSNGHSSENVLVGPSVPNDVENEQHSTLQMPTITEDEFTVEAPVELPGNIMPQSTEDEDRFSLRYIEEVKKTSNDNKRTNGATYGITGAGLADISAVCSDVEEGTAIAHNLEETQASISPELLGTFAAKVASEEIIVMVQVNEKSAVDAYDRQYWSGSCADFDNDGSYEPELPEFQNKTGDVAPPADKISSANPSDVSGEPSDISRLEKGSEREASSASNWISQKLNVATYDIIELDKISAQKSGISGLQRTEQDIAIDKQEGKEVSHSGSASRDVCAETVFEDTEASFMVDEEAFSPPGDPAAGIIEEKEDDAIDGKSKHVVISLQQEDVNSSQIVPSVSLQSPDCVCTTDNAYDGHTQDDGELTEINSTCKDEDGLKVEMQTDVQSSLELQDEDSRKAGDIFYIETLCQEGFCAPNAQGVEGTFCGGDGEALNPSNELRSELRSEELNHFNEKVTERKCSSDAVKEMSISTLHHIVMDTVANKCMDREQDLEICKIETESGGAVEIEPEDKSYGSAESCGGFVTDRPAEAEQSEILTNSCDAGLGKLLEIEKMSEAAQKNSNVNERIRLLSQIGEDNDKASPACSKLLSLSAGDFSADKTMQPQEANQLADQHKSSVYDNYPIKGVSPTSHEHEKLILQTVEKVDDDDEYENILIQNCSECEEKKVDEGTETASLHQPCLGKSKNEMKDVTRLSESACDGGLSQKNFGYSVQQRRERVVDSIHSNAAVAFTFADSIAQTGGDLPSEKLHDDKEMVMEGNCSVGMVTDRPASKVHVATIENVGAKGLREESSVEWCNKEESDFPLNEDLEDLNDFQVSGEVQNTDDSSFTWTFCDKIEVSKERSGKRMTLMTEGETMEIHATGECTETHASAVDLRDHNACKVATKLIAASSIAVDQRREFSEEKDFEMREESSEVIKRIVVSPEETASEFCYSKVDAFECCIGDYTGEKCDRKIHESNLCADIYGNSEAAKQKTYISAESRLDLPGTPTVENLLRNSEKSADEQWNARKKDGDLKNKGISTDAKDKELNVVANPQFAPNGNTQTGFEERESSNTDDDVKASDAFGNVKVNADEAGVASTPGEFSFKDSEDRKKWQERASMFPLILENSRKQAKQNSSSSKKLFDISFGKSDTDNNELQECHKDVSIDIDGKQTSDDKVEANPAEASQVLQDSTATATRKIGDQKATKEPTEVTDDSNIENELRYLQQVPCTELFQLKDTEKELDGSDVNDAAASTHSSHGNKIKSCAVEAEGMHVLEDDVFSLDPEEANLEKLNVISPLKDEMRVNFSVDSAAFPPQNQNKALELILFSGEGGNAKITNQSTALISERLNEDVGHQMEEVAGTNHLECVVAAGSNIEKVEGTEERDKEVLPTVDDIQGSLNFFNLADQSDDSHISLEKVILTEAAEATAVLDAASFKEHSVEDDHGKQDAVRCFNNKDAGEAFELSSGIASSDASTEDQFPVITTNVDTDPDNLAEDELGRQQMSFSPNTIFQGKRKGGNSLYSKQWKSSIMKVKNERTDLAIGTPRKAIDASEMKENALSIKRAQIGGLTAPKVSSERRALEDLSSNHN